MPIKNIIFDVGNVLVKWSPDEIITATFPEYDPKEFYMMIRPYWIDINLGKITEAELVQELNKHFDIPLERLEKLLEIVKVSQIPIPGSLELLERVYNNSDYHLYSITDNTNEILDYHRMNSGFLEKFEAVVSSSDIGTLKPDPKIYNYLLETYNLIPQESVFIDDLERNVQGAQNVGMYGIQFFNAEQCEQALNALGVNVA